MSSPVVFRLPFRDTPVIHGTRGGGWWSGWRKSEWSRRFYFHTCKQILRWGSKSTEMYPRLCLVSFLLSAKITTEPLHLTVLGLFSKSMVGKSLEIKSAVPNHSWQPLGVSPCWRCLSSWRQLQYATVQTIKVCPAVCIELSVLQFEPITSCLIYLHVLWRIFPFSSMWQSWIVFSSLLFLRPFCGGNPSFLQLAACQWASDDQFTPEQPGNGTLGTLHSSPFLLPWFCSVRSSQL